MTIYHERQTRHLCGLHALNNLFQRPGMFSKAELDEYCTTLTPRSWLNPHRSWIGWGNYDVNVIMYAVQQRNREVVWFDRRRDPSCLDLTAIFGFILNVPSQMTIGQLVPLPFQMRHWLAVRRINGSYYNLDSKLRQPACLGSDDGQFLDYLREHLQPDNDHELLLVLDAVKESSASGTAEIKERWLLPQFRD
ncbi:josephin-like protein isoform X2 [Drosophila kikkawai]|nr:josephin-like protein isoform X2 [Drosophila kikkawai]